MYSLKNIREKFLDFFATKDHLVIDSFSLIPQNDPTLLFINSGMAPLKKYFMKEEIPPYINMANSQLCMRVGGKHNDLSDVGYTKRHHTFFEMLGNFSFGGYFQKEIIPIAWEFLTKELNLPANRLFITVHPEDHDAFNLWEKIVGADRITKLEENVWTMGDIGPFGYCSEIFYDLQVGTGDLSSGDRYLEIWNLVFMKFYSDGKTKSVLPSPCIDAGMGLERMVSILEGVSDTYDISFFKNALPILGKTEHCVESKIFLDHLRACAFMISEGLMPGPNAREYVLRRIMRRALKAFDKFENINLQDAAKQILNQWQSEYDYKLDIETTCTALEKEHAQFCNMMDNGMKIFEELFAKNKHFDAQTLFFLHDTHGLSADITYDLLNNKGGSGDIAGFEKLLEESRELSRKKALDTFLPFPATKYIDEYHNEDFIENVNVIGFHEDYIILDQTPFYAQGGGQIGDIGEIQGADWKVAINDTKKIGNVHIHKFNTLSGTPKSGPATAKIDNKRRIELRAHHSATHLLHQAIQNYLGIHATQLGSSVEPDRLRLDFGYNKTITEGDIIEIENIVNAWIRENHPTIIEHMEQQKAKELGAQAHFQYDQYVRTIAFGNRSFELCGGSHVKATGDIGIFKITKVSSISAGVKRIVAVCAQSALKYIQKISQQLKDIADVLNVGEDAIIQKIKNLNNKKEEVKDIKIETKQIDNLIVGYFFGPDINIELEMKKNNLDILCACTQKNEKLGVQLKIADKALSNNQLLDAKKIMEELGIKLLQISGCGGNRKFAQTGSKNIKAKDDIFNTLCEILISFFA